jgi:hypothetical protein
MIKGVMKVLVSIDLDSRGCTIFEKANEVRKHIILAKV